MPDVVLIGAGHNGLTSACYMARAGLDVEVVEANEKIGGCITSSALVSAAPQHVLNACAADIITLRSSSIVADLDLVRHGFQQVRIDPA